MVDRPWADETITVSVEKRMGGGREEGQGKKGRRGEEGNERGKTR